MLVALVVLVLVRRGVRAPRDEPARARRARRLPGAARARTARAPWRGVGCWPDSPTTSTSWWDRCCSSPCSRWSSGPRCSPCPPSTAVECRADRHGHRLRGLPHRARGGRPGVAGLPRLPRRPRPALRRDPLGRRHLLAARQPPADAALLRRAGGPRAARAVRPSCTTAPADVVVLSAHSQGSVLAAAMLMRPQSGPGRVVLLTYGAPLRRLYARFFPAYFGPAAFKDTLATTGQRWVNLYARSDPIGAWVLQARRAPVDVRVVEPRLARAWPPTARTRRRAGTRATTTSTSTTTRCAPSRSTPATTSVGDSSRACHRGGTRGASRRHGTGCALDRRCRPGDRRHATAACPDRPAGAVRGVLPA